MKKDELTTNKEKASFIVDNGFSSLSQSTLERKPSDYLDKIIELERDLEEGEYSKEDKEATKSMIEMVLDFLDGIKKERENKGISEPIKKFILKNSENLSFANKRIKGIIGLIMLGIAGVFVAIDSFFGIEKLKGFIREKWKNQTK